jgi:multiple antibiotic resistance protein
MSFLSAAILLFLVIDPLGNLVTINSLLHEIPTRQRQRLILRECVIALGILIVFLVAGNSLLSALDLRASTLSVSGGIVLFLIALGMVFPSRAHPAYVVDGSPVLVPIAVPLIAGPSSLAVLLLMAKREPESLGKWMAALGVAMGVSTIILVLSPLFYEKLGKPLTSAIERLVGMLLITLSIQMFLDGIAAYFSE